MKYKPAELLRQGFQALDVSFDDVEIEVMADEMSRFYDAGFQAMSGESNSKPNVERISVQHGANTAEGIHDNTLSTETK
jgi:hypothetical protein